MRTRPLVGKKLWFIPRGFGGWGWTPASWEGWVIVGIGTIAIVAPIPLIGEIGPVLYQLWAFGVVLGLFVICSLKGTSPGGRRKRAEYFRERETGSPAASEPARKDI